MTEDEPLPEATLLKRLMFEATRLGVRLFRNQVGQYKLADGRYLTSGLCVGSSDLIGYYPVTITPAMVGRTVAVFVAVEAKGPRGVVRKPQQQFVDAINHAGGIATITKSSDLTPALVAWRLHL